MKNNIFFRIFAVRQICDMGKILPRTIGLIGLIYKIILMLSTAALIVLIFPHSDHGEHFDYKVGAVWRDGDLNAPYDFTVMKSAEEVAAEEAAVRGTASLYLRREAGAHNEALQRLAQLEGLTTQQRWLMRREIDSIYALGYVVPDGEYGPEQPVVVLEGNIGSEGRLGDVVSYETLPVGLLRDSILVPSLTVDAERTALELESRLSQQKYSSRLVLAGERIVSKGEEVTPEKAELLASLEAENDRRFSDHYSLWGQMGGQLLLAIIAFVALYMFLKNTRHPILDDNRKVLFVMVLILLMSALEALVVRIAPEWVLIVPLCIVPILVRVFFDMRVALYIHLTTVIILANLVPNSFEFIFYQLVTGIMSIIATRGLERRSQFFVLSLVIFVSYSFIYTAGVLSQDTNLHALNGDRYLIFFLNALFTLLSYPLIYLFERLFGITTDLTLLELSSTATRPLRELSRRAPGTFQHAMQVANITEDLLSELGGDVLLGRVGALYHDIGKMTNPLYFTENQTAGFNPHNELDYIESARLITQHVTDGLELARKYHLPAEVQDFIRTHHGTTYTGYFYAKEKERHPEGFDATPFRYPGPTPYSRETAVVMIVDTVEAACRSMKEHTKESTDAMVDRLIDGKIAGGQLDNSPLTYGDIARIRTLLKAKMMSIYHVRIEYPTIKTENKN